MIEGFEYLDYIVDEIVSTGIDDFEYILNKLIVDVRLELSKRFDVSTEVSYTFNYRSLCDESCGMIDYILSNVSVRLFKSIGIFHRHGEQKHTPRIESKYWPYQHSWLIIEYNDERWFIDATCQQFRWLYDDIPDYYISKEPPEWFYDDRDNPCWNGITKYINSFIKVPRCIDGVKFHDGIVEYIQYETWGSISDSIRKRKGEINCESK